MNTIIKIKTWKCSSCNARQDAKNNSICFSCKKSTMLIEPAGSCIVSVMNNSAIEQEIIAIEKRKIDKTDFGQDPDISTPAKKNAFKNKRKQEIKDEIKRNKELEYN